MAMLAWLLGMLVGFLGPLIIYLVKKDQSRFIAFHALQSLFFGFVVVGAVMVVLILGVVTCGIGLLLLPIVWLGALVIAIMWCIKANNGEWAELPVIGGWARK